MQLRILLSPEFVCDGITNTFTAKIADMCLAENKADVTSIVDAVTPTALFNLPQGGQSSATVTLNAKGTAVTVVLAITPAAGDGSMGLELLRNV